MSRKHGCLALLFLLAIALGYLGYAQWQFSRSFRVQFVLPNDYRGWFVIQDTNATFKPWVSDPVEFQIPDSGTLVSDKIWVLRHWHQMRVQYENGTVLREDWSYEGDLNGRLYVFNGSTMSTGDTYYFVGTEEVWEAVRYDRPIVTGSVTDRAP